MTNAKIDAKIAEEIVSACMTNAKNDAKSVEEVVYANINESEVLA